MEKRDMSISNDDLTDIFGAPEPPPVKTETLKKLPPINDAVAATVAPKIAAEKKEEPALKSKLVMNRAEEAYRIQEELAARQAEQKELEAAGEAAAAAVAASAAKKQGAAEPGAEENKQAGAPVSYGSLSDAAAVAELINAYNVFKKEFAKELAGKIDQKAIDNMMLRSLEKTAVNFVLLRNTSWDPDGKMPQDGDIFTDRLVKNTVQYGESIKEMDKEIEESLKALLVMRLVAVKKGLGADKYAEIKDGLARRFSLIAAGMRKATADFIKVNVIDNAIRKADEEK